MAKVTKEQLERILTKRLSLTDPQFFLKKAGGRLVGNIVSPGFKGRRDHERQELIWNALDAEWGAESAVRVGMLLAYAPDEWNLDEDSILISGRAKKAG